MDEAQPAKPRPRIESLSDLVFGLALSIGAIALVSNPPKTVPGLYVDIASFGFTFLVLISVWMGYTRIMSALPVETRRVTTLNSMLLFTVILEPFLFNILTSSNSSSPASVSLQGAASSLYGVDIGAMLTIMGVFTLMLIDEERHLIPVEMMGQYKLEMVVRFVGGGLFFVSTLPYFGGVSIWYLTARECLWLAGLLLLRARRGIGRRMFGQEPDEG